MVCIYVLQAQNPKELKIISRYILESGAHNKTNTQLLQLIRMVKKEKKSNSDEST